MKNLYAVILAGGRGERFWPRGRFDRPKQNVRLFGKRTMLAETYARAASVVRKEHIFVVTGKDCAAATRSDLPRDVRRRVLVEPCGRNTAAAAGWACGIIEGLDSGAVVTVMPSDHMVTGKASFKRDLLKAAREAAAGECIVTIGIKPSYPATGYGYIETVKGGAGRGTLSRRVRRFTEKPDLKHASAFVKGGHHFWNSGIFVCRAGVMLSAIRSHMPGLSRMLDSLAAARTAAGRSSVIRRLYPRLKSVSLDYGIMEKYRDIRMVKATFGWDDLGSWRSAARFGRRDRQGNRAIGDHISIDSKGCVVVTGPGHVLATIGLEGYTVITADDATLIARNDRLQDVRRIVTELKKHPRYKRHLYIT